MYRDARVQLTWPCLLVVEAGTAKGRLGRTRSIGWSDGRVGDRPFEAPLKRANIPLGCTIQSSIHRGIQLAPVAGNLK